LTGDFADGPVEDFGQELSPIADLKAPHGKYFVTGNHEYYWDLTGWLARFKEMGMRLLSNEHVIIECGGGAIILAGVTDYSTVGMGTDHACNPKRALVGAPSNLTKILLAHQPATYRMAHEADFDLQLSGHTHGGQYFPFSFLIRYFQRYYRGLNRHENMWVYVNSGTGYWGPPLRLGAPSEITLITLRPETL
jgi:predicted MPP superfamily phosphohydrolase